MSGEARGWSDYRPALRRSAGGGPERSRALAFIGMGGGTSSRVRLRQAVLVAGELEPAASALREALGLGEPFRDPGVREFGLANVVFALGDGFLEIVSPIRPDTAAGRYLQRRGAGGGYMVIFDLEDLRGARTRARQLGVRVVWQIDLPDISGTHLHPADMSGAIVSIDRSEPYGTWRWGGPDWTGRTGHGAAGRLTGITVAVEDPEWAARRWGEVLGLRPVGEDGEPRLDLDGGAVRFRPAGAKDREGITEIAVERPAAGAEAPPRIDLGGVGICLRMVAPDTLAAR